jgi:excisionase family DNA binding protein
MTDTPNGGALDLLYGADKIAEFMGVSRPTVYHLTETKRIPYFKMGAVICARRSRLTEALDQLEVSAA